MTGGKTVLEELDDVDLAAGGGQGEEVQIMDVDISVPVRLGMPGIEDIHLVELLGAFGAVLEHGAHGGIAVDVGILALDIVVHSVLEGEVLQGLHQAGVHLPHPGALCPVQNVFLGSAGMAVFDQGVLHCVLDLLHGGSVALDGGLHIVLDLLGQILRHLVVIAAQHLGCLVDGICNLYPVKGNFASIPLDDHSKHSALLLTL